KYLVAVARIDQDAGEIAERKIATTNSPRCPTIMRHEQSLLRSDVDVIRALWILRNRVDRSFTRYTVNLSPRLSAVARNQDSGARRSNPDCFRLSLTCRNARRAWIEASVRKFLPTFRWVDSAIQTRVSGSQ